MRKRGLRGSCLRRERLRWLLRMGRSGRGRR
jgi:hypothetical protein